MKNIVSSPKLRRISGISIAVLAILLFFGLTFYDFFPIGGEKISGNPEFTSELRQFEAELNSINIPNQLGTKETSSNPGTVGRHRTCDKVTSNILTGETTKNTCSVYYTRYFGNDGKDTLGLVKDIDAAIEQAGWKYDDKFDSKEEAIKDLANTMKNSEMDYTKGGYRIKLSFLTTERIAMAKPCSSYPACS